MSLINDLLCELHERKASPPSRMSIHDLQPVRRAPRRRVWLLPVAGVLAASSAWAVFHADVLPSTRARGPAPVPVSLIPPSQPPAAQPVARQRLAKVLAPVQSTPPAAPHTTETLAVFKLTLDHVINYPIPKIRDDKRPVRRAAPAKDVTADLPQPPAKVRTVDPTADGLILLAAARYAQAESIFRSVTQSDPASTPAWLHLARAIDAQGRSSEAQAALTQALGLVSEPAPIARALARQLLTRGKVHESLRLLVAYRPSHELEVDHDAFIAALQQRLGQHDMAAERYRTILAVRPEFAAWWVGLAISEEARGHGDAAIDAYRHANNIGNLDPRLADYVAVRLAAMQGNDAS